MLKKTAFELRNALFLSPTSEVTTEALVYIVLELLVEVEALREAHIRSAKDEGIRPKDSPYGESFKKTGLLTHNAAGPTLGIDKLLTQFFPARDTDSLRENLMLKRLGFTEEEIADYEAEAEFLSQLS